MRIAYLANPSNANGFYRGIGPMAHLKADGHAVRQLDTDRHRPPLAGVRDVDVLHIHRYCDDRALKLVREAKRHGAAVVWDDDDDFGVFERGARAYRRHGGLAWERRLVALRTIFRQADVVTTTSETLAERLRSYGAGHTVAIENYVPGRYLHGEHEIRSRGPVTIGWIAGLEHHVDMERIPIQAALQRVLDERPDVQVEALGLGLGLRGDRYTKTRFVPILELIDYASTWDVGIAPLANLAFNQSKSNVKLKEYAAGATPWLASPVGPYLGMGERQGGRLVADDRWYEEITRLLDKPRERRKLAKRAVKWAAEETLERNFKRWEAVLGEAVERAAPALAG